MRTLHAAILFVPTLLSAACHRESPPAVPARAPAVPPIAPPPWRTRASVSQGYEPAEPPPSKPVVIKNATIFTAAGKVIPRGSIVLVGGKIASVGEGEPRSVPLGADVVDAAGKFVTPGLIDSHSHLGVYPWPGARAHADGNEMTDPVFPHAQSVDAFWPQDPAIERAVAGGVTTIQVLPGSGNLVGGRAVTLKLRRAHSGREMHVPGAPDGLKMACGENPKRVYGEGKRTPMSRMGNLALQRAAFLKAHKLARDWNRWGEGETKRLRTFAKKRAEYERKVEQRARQRKWCADYDWPSQCDDWKKQWDKEPLDAPEPSDAAAPPDRDPGLETLVAAMEGRVLVQVHCYRADDMKAMIALANEVGFTIRSFHHALEAYKIRDDLAARGISVSTWADWWGFKMEAYDGIPENLALVHEAGGRAVVHSDSPEGIQRLNQEAAKGLAAGRRAGVALDDDAAIRWITIQPAWTLGIDGRTGSLEAGKDADVVLWSAHPLSAYAAADRVWIDGALRYQRGPGARWSDFELGQDESAVAPRAAPEAKQQAAQPPPRTLAAPPAATGPGAPKAIAIVGARVHTGTGERLDDATLVIAGGLVRAVGKGAAVPDGAETIDGKGLVVTPGLIDPLTSIGLVEIDLEKGTRDDEEKGGDPIRAAFRAADGYNPASSVVGVTRAEGVTSVGVVPSGGLVSGQSAWADLDGATAATALALAPLAIHVRFDDPEGGGHATAVLKVREAFDDARTFAKVRGAWERNQSRPFAPSRLDLEALVTALDGKVPVVFHVDRAAEILAALEVAREFKLRPIVAGGAEAWKVAPLLAAAKVPVVVFPLRSGPESFESIGGRDDLAARLVGAGVRVAISTGETHNARKLRQVAANAVRAGLPHEAAITAITSAPADAFGLGARYGTLAPGRVANVTVWTGDPLEHGTNVARVFIRGREVSLANRQTALRDRYRRLTP